MEWKAPFPNMVGTRVRRVKGKNKGKEGVIEEIFSVSGTVSIRYSNGKLDKFCDLDNFEKIE